MSTKPPHTYAPGFVQVAGEDGPRCMFGLSRHHGGISCGRPELDPVHGATIPEGTDVPKVEIQRPKVTVTVTVTVKLPDGSSETYGVTRVAEPERGLVRDEVPDFADQHLVKTVAELRDVLSPRQH